MVWSGLELQSVSLELQSVTLELAWEYTALWYFFSLFHHFPTWLALSVHSQGPILHTPCYCLSSNSLISHLVSATTMGGPRELPGRAIYIDINSNDYRQFGLRVQGGTSSFHPLWMPLVAPLLRQIDNPYHLYCDGLIIRITSSVTDW